MDILLLLITQMKEGKIPTSPKIECPYCGGTILISAGQSFKDASSINISMVCQSCDEVREICGKSKWKSWELLKPVK